MILLALLVIAMAVAAPKIAADIQRDRDLETMQRGKQYIRAIKLYYKKFQAYPPNLDALVKTNEIRFLRKKYIDPTTGKDDWKPIMFGQNKTPMAMGFFGQPLGGPGMGATPIAGIGPGGVSDSATTPPTDTSGTPTTSTTSPTTNNGPTFGGAGIIGVSPVSPKQSIYVYKKKNHYNEWEFLYSPLSDQPIVGGGGIGGGGIGGGGVGGGLNPSGPPSQTTPAPQQ
jgi:type II secretory pathway pseudopilin PulG